MARAVPPWLWGVLIRDHAPKDPTLRHVLLTLRTYMDAEGYAFPSQRTLAAAACLSEQTVRKKLAEASERRWLGRYARARSGQQWKSYSYQACIPDSLVLTNPKHTDLANAWAAQVGEVEEGALKSTLYPQLRNAKHRSEDAVLNTTKDPVSPSKRSEPPHFDNRAPRADKKAPRPRAGKYRKQSAPKLLSEVLNEVERGKVPLSRTPLKSPEDVKLQKARALESLDSRILRLLDALPDQPSAALAKMVFGATPERVEALRHREHEQRNSETERPSK